MVGPDPRRGPVQRIRGQAPAVRAVDDGCGPLADLEETANRFAEPGIDVADVERLLAILRD
jgi:hypothetical protein